MIDERDDNPWLEVYALLLILRLSVMHESNTFSLLPPAHGRLSVKRTTPPTDGAAMWLKATNCSFFGSAFFKVSYVEENTAASLVVDVSYVSIDRSERAHSRPGALPRTSLPAPL